MQDVFVSDTFAERILEAIERGCTVSIKELHLDGAYPGLECSIPKRSRNEEVDLHALLSLLESGLGIEEETVPLGDERLRNRVFHDHPLVDCDVIDEQGSICLLRDMARVREGMGDEQSCIRQVAFE